MRDACREGTPEGGAGAVPAWRGHTLRRGRLWASSRPARVRSARCSLHWCRGGSSRLHSVIPGSAARSRVEASPASAHSRGGAPTGERPLLDPPRKRGRRRPGGAPHRKVRSPVDALFGAPPPSRFEAGKKSFRSCRAVRADASDAIAPRERGRMLQASPPARVVPLRAVKDRTVKSDVILAVFNRDSSAPSWPDLFRPSTSFIQPAFQDADARDKRGHDISEPATAGLTSSSRKSRGRSACGGFRWCRRRSRRAWRRAAAGRPENR